MRNVVRHNSPERQVDALPARVGIENGQRVRLRADGDIGLEIFHQRHKRFAVASLDQRADPARQVIEPRAVVQRLPDFRSAADGHHVRFLNQRAPTRMRILQEVHAERFNRGIDLMEGGLHGTRRGVMAAVSHQVANQDLRHAVPLRTALSNSAAL